MTEIPSPCTNYPLTLPFQSDQVGTGTWVIEYTSGIVTGNLGSSVSGSEVSLVSENSGVSANVLITVPSGETLQAIAFPNVYVNLSNTHYYGAIYTMGPLAPVIGYFIATPTSLVCATMNTGSVLSWATYGTALTCSIDNGVGSVAVTGTVTVYPVKTTTYTLTATNLTGTSTQQVTVTVDTSVCASLVTGASTQWNSGATYAAGVYKITCCGGAYEYNPAGFSVGYGWTINGDTDYDNGYEYQVPSRGFYLYSGANQPSLAGCTMAPGSRTNYDSVYDCGTSEYGANDLFYHTGGVISLFLEDNPYWDNVAGYLPPVFMIQGPGPAITFGASSTGPVVAGTSITLSWNVASYGTQTIDNGIGSVSASGTTTVSPSVTTTYTLAATGTSGAGSIVQVASVTVVVYAVGAPSNLNQVSACGGEIGLTWTPGLNGTDQLVQRSPDGSTWSTLETVSPGIASYLDGAVTRGTEYFYRIANTDGVNTFYSNTFGATALLLPVAPTSLETSTAALVVYLSWTPSDTNSVNIYRGETLLTGDLLANADSYVDFGPLVSGETYTYTVQSVNTCGETADSSPVTATPYASLNPYTPVNPPATNWT